MPQDQNRDETEAEKGESLDAVAARWVARVDRCPLSPSEAQALEQWLAAGTRHRGAFARAQAALAYFDRDVAEAVAADGLPPVQEQTGVEPALVNMTRRRLLWIGGGIAGAAAASVAALTLTDTAPTVGYSAKRGEIRLVQLGDGSMITLDTASAVAVQYHRRTRNVDLLAGRALFDVAKDKARPFVVTAGGLRVQAVGTSFVVRKAEAHPPEVLVQEGLVDVGQDLAKAPIRVGANMRVVASTNAGPALSVTSVDPAAVTRELAWRQGMLAFEDVSLATVAEEFARYSDARIIITDPKLAAVTITGLFAANNPFGFARAAALSLGLSLDIKGQEIRLHRS